MSNSKDSENFEDKKPEWIIERDKREFEDKKVVKVAIETILDKINCMGFEKEVGKVISKQLSSTHRTLQQRFFADVIIPVILKYAEMGHDKRFDARNEASCKKAIELEDLLKEAYFPFI